jgi:sugar transferase (PEP-CTERM/EpsH1 system associated)
MSGPQSAQPRYVTPAAGRLHVVHVVLSLDVGGLERNVVNQVRQGQKLGQRVSIVCLERPGTLAPQVEGLGATLVSLHKRPGLRPGVVLSMRRALRGLAPDVVHTHQLATLLYGGAAARLMRVPVVVHTEHGREPYAARRKTRLLGRLAGRFCDRFYCLTADMAEQVRAAEVVASEKIRVIRNGIDVARFAEPGGDRAALRQSLGIPPEALVVGTVGRLNEIKCQDLLIRAFARVRQQLGCAHLVLVGDGPRLRELRTLSSDLGVGDCVHFPGYQPSSAPYLRIMDVFALTSRSEGMPQAVLEASVAGVPVVASRVGGLPEVIVDRQTGLLFGPGDESALAWAIEELLGDEGMRRRIGAAGKARVETSFSVARMAAEYHRDFLEILGTRAPLRAVTQVSAGAVAAGAEVSAA